MRLVGLFTIDSVGFDAFIFDAAVVVDVLNIIGCNVFLPRSYSIFRSVVCIIAVDFLLSPSVEASFSKSIVAIVVVGEKVSLSISFVFENDI